MNARFIRIFDRVIVGLGALTLIAVFALAAFTLWSVLT